MKKAELEHFKKNPRRSSRLNDSNKPTTRKRTLSIPSSFYRIKPKKTRSTTTVR